MSRFLASQLLLLAGCLVGAAALEMVRIDVPGTPGPPGLLVGFAVLLGYIAGQVDR